MESDSSSPTTTADEGTYDASVDFLSTPAGTAIKNLLTSFQAGYARVEVIRNNVGTPEDYLFLEVNDVFELHHGISSMKGQNASVLFEGKPDLMHTCTEVAEHGGAASVVWKSQAADKWLEVHVSRADTGDDDNLLLLSKDITDRLQAEDYYKSLQEHSRRTFVLHLEDQLRPLGKPEEIVSTSARLLGEHLKVNRCAYASIEDDQDTMYISGDYTHNVPSIVGRYTFAQFGSDVLELMRADAPYVVDDVEQRGLPPEVLESYHLTRIRSVICVPLHKEGRFVAAMAVHQDEPRTWTGYEVELLLHVANRCWEALQRVKIEAELRASEEHFRTMADNIAQLAWMNDAEGNVFWYNKRWQDYTGLTLENAGGWNWESIHHEDHFERIYHGWKNALKEGERWEATCPIRGADGSYRWFLSQALPIRNSDGQVIRWFGTSTDITEQREASEIVTRAKEEAEAANKAKDTFLAVLSHELRTPLTPVLMAAEHLCTEPDISAEMHETFCMIQKNISLEARIIDDLLDVTSISQGKMKLVFQDEDIQSVVKHAIDIVMDDAQEKNITIESKAFPRGVYVHCDSARLQQVFWNLLNNAIKFSRTRSKITVEAALQKDIINISVTDSGCGIPDDLLDRIFMPFEQGGYANKPRYGGLGLGLAISRSFVEMHKGTLKAFSKGSQQGSTFKVTLPVTRREEANLPPATPAMYRDDTDALADNIEPLRLLVVEDHAPTLSVLARLLQRLGHEVITASSCADALIKAEKNNIELVISDIGLPDASGLELMQMLRRQYSLRGIALSGYGTERDQKLAAEAGFVSHITKPVAFSVLKSVLRQAVQDGHIKTNTSQL